VFHFRLFDKWNYGIKEFFKKIHKNKIIEDTTLFVERNFFNGKCAAPDTAILSKFNFNFEDFFFEITKKEALK
jgi:hypothetical protein